MDFASRWGLIMIEGSILSSFILLIFFLRRALRLIPSRRAKAFSTGKKDLEVNLEKINQLLVESESLSRNFSSNLVEKRELAKQLIETLDERIRILKQLLEKIEGKIPASNSGPNGKDGNGQILDMAMAGCGVDDIAKRLGLSKEEVQLILDLRKIATN